MHCMNSKKREYTRWDDTNDHTELIGPQCKNCAHWNGPDYPTTCEAFPNGIPGCILSNEVVHDSGYPGDHGILYEPRA